MTIQAWNAEIHVKAAHPIDDAKKLLHFLRPFVRSKVFNFSRDETPMYPTAWDPAGQ